jgi:hypothetical protein
MSNSSNFRDAFREAKTQALIGPSALENKQISRKAVIHRWNHGFYPNFQMLILLGMRDGKR